MRRSSLLTKAACLCAVAKERESLAWLATGAKGRGVCVCGWPAPFESVSTRAQRLVDWLLIARDELAAAERPIVLREGEPGHEALDATGAAIERALVALRSARTLARGAKR